MVHIQKEAEPLLLTQAKRRGLKHYSDMDSDTRTAIKEALLEEQYHLCAYCMRRITLDSMQIEHYIAQNPVNTQTDPASTIDYHNMLGVCSGEKNQFHALSQLTCDQHRKSTPITIDPLNSASVAHVKYASDGAIYSDDAAICRDLCETLNLNCQAAKLVENRKSALDALKKWIKNHYKGKTISKAEWLRIQNHLCAPTAGTQREYVGILDYYLNKKAKSAQ